MTSEGTLIANRYRMHERVGRGATKAVYRGVDTHDGKTVAIAVMPYVAREDFDAEVEIARRLDGPHIARTLDAIYGSDDVGYLIMEYCDGVSLASLVDKGPLSVTRAAPIMLGMARALCAIHDACILHRDIKLENVIVGDGNQLKLWVIDFGLSARARSSMTAVFHLREIVAGTVPYMAPEVARGGHLDARSDVYAFGACCFRLLTGAAPKDMSTATSQAEALQIAANHDVPVDVSGVPEPMRELVGKMLAPVQADRPYMPAVVDALVELFGAMPPVVSAPPQLSRPCKGGLWLSHRIRVRAAHPDRVHVATCGYAPIITWEQQGNEARVHALTFDGAYRWGASLAGIFTRGVRADLDGDGVHEMYLVGPGMLAAIDARGTVRYVNRVPCLGDAIVAAGHRLVVDGHAFDPWTGELVGPIAAAFTGDGTQLVHGSFAGVAYHGRAHQAFGGRDHSGAALLASLDANEFHVAMLELAAAHRVRLAIYGPGGACVARLHVIAPEIETGDIRAIDALAQRPAVELGPEQAPVAIMDGRGRATVIVPFIHVDRSWRTESRVYPTPTPLPSTLVGYASEPWRETWRKRVEGARGGIVLGDLDGDGRIELMVPSGQTIRVVDALTGDDCEPIPSPGVPIALGDPASTGYRHLVTVERDAIDVWRGPDCLPGAMQWSGARGDAWHTGTFGPHGRALGPV